MLAVFDILRISVFPTKGGIMWASLHSVVGLIVATGFLIWVSEKNGNPMQKLGKVVGWICFVIVVFGLITQLYYCSRMCLDGQCPRWMGGGMGMGMSVGPGMMHNKMMTHPDHMPPPPPPPPAK